MLLDRGQSERGLDRLAADRVFSAVLAHEGRPHHLVDQRGRIVGRVGRGIALDPHDVVEARHQCQLRGRDEDRRRDLAQAAEDRIRVVEQILIRDIGDDRHGAGHWSSRERFFAKASSGCAIAQFDGIDLAHRNIP
ncbi:hypothetical protein [Bradyrhizobium sp. BR 1433]|uniref:hypothetical protein n=1 Tax=Bradyrhizobium sp. BR 1433 TaxID=3447967 RepID=UPI003EE464E1